VLQTLVAKEDALRERGLLQLGLGQDGAKWLGLDIDEGELFDTLYQLQDLGYVSFQRHARGWIRCTVSRSAFDWTWFAGARRVAAI
jgi:hypothetical protein